MKKVLSMFFFWTIALFSGKNINAPGIYELAEPRQEYALTLLQHQIERNDPNTFRNRFILTQGDLTKFENYTALDIKVKQAILSTSNYDITDAKNYAYYMQKRYKGNHVDVDILNFIKKFLSSIKESQQMTLNDEWNRIMGSIDYVIYSNKGWFSSNEKYDHYMYLKRCFEILNTNRHNENYYYSIRELIKSIYIQPYNTEGERKLLDDAIELVRKLFAKEHPLKYLWQKASDSLRDAVGIVQNVSDSLKDAMYHGREMFFDITDSLGDAAFCIADWLLESDNNQCDDYQQPTFSSGGHFNPPQYQRSTRNPVLLGSILTPPNILTPKKLLPLPRPDQWHNVY